MPRSPLARLQQITTLSLIAAATAWLAWQWPRSPWLAVAGAAAIVLGYTFFLAAEFIALYFISRRDSSPVPSAWEIVRAWGTETLAAPRVFCWRQPFRWAAVPDGVDEHATPTEPRRGVVLIHGFMCNRGFWTPWFKPLREGGHAFVAVNLEPWFGSIDDYVAIIDEAVTRISRATGLPPVLVCHSMGGLAARAWLRARQAHARVAHVITISTPHRGTWLGRFGLSPNGRQMGLQSEWLRGLDPNGNPQNALFTCWYSNCDNIAVPTSTATLPGADNRLVRGMGHVALAFHPQVMADALARIAKVSEEAGSGKPS